jgi:O-Antigen ligase
MQVLGGNLTSRAARSRLERMLTAVILVAMSYEAAVSITREQPGHFPKPLLLILVLAGAAVLFRVATEHLLLAWLALGPFFQESAQKTRLGHLLSLALYTAPPIVFALKTLFTRGRRPRMRWFDVVPGAYVVLIFASLLITATSVFTSSAVGTTRTFYQTFALGALVYYVVAFWPGLQLSATRICRLLLLTASVEAVMSTIEWRTGWNLWHDTGWSRGAGDTRSVATLANPGLLGAYIGAGMAVALAVLCWNGPSSLRRLSILTLVVGPLGLFATLTRGPILGTLIACVLIALVAERSRAVAVGMLAVAGLVLVILWGSISSSSLYQSRISNPENVDVRLALQKASFSLAERKPILGWGYGSFDKVKTDVQLSGTIGAVAAEAAVEGSTSHNTFLTVLVEYGTVGLLLLVVPWLWISWYAVRRIRERSPERWLYVGGLGVVFVIAFTGGTLDLRFFSFVPMVLWLFLALMRRAEALTPAAIR